MVYLIIEFGLEFDCCLGYARSTCLVGAVSNCAELGGLKRVEKRMKPQEHCEGEVDQAPQPYLYELTPKGDRWVRWFEAKAAAVSSQNKSVKRDASET